MTKDVLAAHLGDLRALIEKQLRCLSIVQKMVSELPIGDGPEVLASVASLHKDLHDIAEMAALVPTIANQARDILGDRRQAEGSADAL